MLLGEGRRGKISHQVVVQASFPTICGFFATKWPKKVSLPHCLPGSLRVLTVLGVADEIIAHVNIGSRHEEVVVTTLAEQHAEKVEPGQIEAIKDMLNDQPQKKQRLLN